MSSPSLFLAHLQVTWGLLGLPSCQSVATKSSGEYDYDDYDDDDDRIQIFSPSDV